MNSLTRFKNKLTNHEAVIGPFMKTADPAFVEATGYAGMDFAILDMEHGPVGIETMQNLIRAAEVSGVLPIVRVSAIDEASIGKALDVGAAGVQLPMITTKEEAELAISLSKFYPRGHRGVCRFVRAANYSAMDKGEYFETANENLVILQLEGEEAINNLDEILEVDGIDIIFIGPYDLSQSLGVPGDITNPLVVDKMMYIVDKVKDKGIVVGTFVDEPENIALWKEAGLQYISYSVDVGIYTTACKALKEVLDKC